MNIEEHIKTQKQLPIGKRTIIHLMLVSNKVNETLTLALKPFGVSIQQFNVLRILRGQKKEPANLSTINERMVTKMSNTTRLVDKLLAKGYVDRVTCESNRRKIEITITDKGQDVLMKMDQTMNATEQNIVQHFSNKELLSLNSLLNKF